MAMVVDLVVGAVEDAVRVVMEAVVAHGAVGLAVVDPVVVDAAEEATGAEVVVIGEVVGAVDVVRQDEECKLDRVSVYIARLARILRGPRYGQGFLFCFMWFTFEVMAVWLILHIPPRA